MTNSETELKKSTDIKNDEIDLIALIKIIWGGRKTIIKTIVIFTCIGFFIAIFSKKEYTASTTMVPQLNNPSSNLGGISSLASLAGFNLDMNSGGFDISPVLYPKIVSSVPFQIDIMNTKYNFENLAEPVSLYNYYLNFYKPSIFEAIYKYSIELPVHIISTIKRKSGNSTINKNPEIISLNKDQDKFRKLIDNNLILEVNDKNGYISLFSKFHDPALSAQIAKKAQILLQEYIIHYKVEKATSQLAFISDRYNEKKNEYETAQSKLAKFKDKNKNIISSQVHSEEDRLQNEYQLAFDVYSELAKQVEQAKIKVEEDTPVFLIIEDVVVPIRKTKPKRILIISVWLFIGTIIGFCITAGRLYFAEIKTHSF